MEFTQVYPKLFFELQLIFAHKIAQISHQPFQDVVLHYTALYRILGLDWSFDPNHPVWQTYLNGLQKEIPETDWTYQFYLTHYNEIPRFTDEAHWGCFAYQYSTDSHTIHLHFSDEDTSEYGALSHHRIGVRMAELRTMFSHIKQTHLDAKLVRGGSWLYNLESYKRLFPVEYGQSAQVAEPHFRTRSVWGQFLRHDWQVKQETMLLFLKRVSRLREVQHCAQCFPCQTLRTEYSIRLFYDFYEV